MNEAAALAGVSDTFTLSAGLSYINGVTGVLNNPVSLRELSESLATFNMTKYASVVFDLEQAVTYGRELQQERRVRIYILLQKGATEINPEDEKYAMS